ncbi:MAG: hypothetical protein A2Y38_00750 [Spirochaetes bacterium GWB1_59_5]|nr:MAG: hypothetical protein A2Y38_00750 [Spirochaetes bacterium GWB1_59_5]
MVAVLHAGQSGLTKQGGPWLTQCVEHDVVVASASRSIACNVARDPAEWCPACKKSGPATAEEYATAVAAAKVARGTAPKANAAKAEKKAKPAKAPKAKAARATKSAF